MGYLEENTQVSVRISKKGNIKIYLINAFSLINFVLVNNDKENTKNTHRTHLKIVIIRIPFCSPF